MTTIPRRVSRGVTASAALGVTGLALALAAPGVSALASAHGHHKASTATSTGPKGDNGDVKIHNSSTAVTDQRNEPHVCVFYLDAFNFDSGQSVSWNIESWPPTGNRSVVDSGTLVLDSNGDGHTGDMSLQNGHYKLFWNFAGENGAAKHKVFWVACPGQTPGHKHHKGKKTTPPVPAAPSAKPVQGTLPVTG
jgi:hypothetical protein